LLCRCITGLTPELLQSRQAAIEQTGNAQAKSKENQPEMTWAVVEKYPLLGGKDQGPSNPAIPAIASAQAKASVTRYKTSYP